MNKDVLFGVLGNLAVFISNLLLVPIYINYLGLSAFGIISIVSTIMALFVILDAGLGVAVAREVSLKRNGLNGEIFVTNLLKTLEAIYLISSLIIAITLIVFADFISRKLLPGEPAIEGNHVYSIRLIALIIFFKWPFNLYQNMLLGFGKIKLINSVKIGISVIQILISVLIIVLLDLGLNYVLLMMVGLNFFGLMVYSILTWKNIQFKRTLPKIDLGILSILKKHVLTASLFSIIGVLYMNTDKLFITKYCGLDNFGIYSIVSTMGLALLQVIYPMTSALFKEYSFALSKDKHVLAEYQFKRIYQFATIISFTFLSIILVFYRDLILIWTNKNILVNELSNIGIPFFIGMLFYSLHNILIIPMIIKSDLFKLNLLYSVAWIVSLIGYSLILPKSSSLLGASIIFCCSNIVLYIFTLFAHIENKGVIKNVKSVFRFLYYEFSLPVTICFFNYLFIVSLKSVISFVELSTLMKLILITCFTMFSLFSQALGSVMIRKKVLRFFQDIKVSYANMS